MKYTTDWITESSYMVSAPCDVRLATIVEIYGDYVVLDDGGMYLVPPRMSPIEIGQQVIARVPWDDYGYIESLEESEE